MVRSIALRNRDGRPTGPATCEGELRLGDELVNESFIGTCFTGRIVGETEAGVLPEITGRAFVTGHTEFVLDPDDPLPAGFLV